MLMIMATLPPYVKSRQQNSAYERACFLDILGEPANQRSQHGVVMELVKDANDGSAVSIRPKDLADGADADARGTREIGEDEIPVDDIIAITSGDGLRRGERLRVLRSDPDRHT